MRSSPSVGGDNKRIGRNALSSLLGGRAGHVLLLVNAFMNRGGLNLLSWNLGRLDKLVEDEAMCAKDELHGWKRPMQGGEEDGTMTTAK